MERNYDHAEQYLKDNYKQGKLPVLKTADTIYKANNEITRLKAEKALTLRNKSVKASAQKEHEATVKAFAKPSSAFGLGRELLDITVSVFDIAYVYYASEIALKKLNFLSDEHKLRAKIPKANNALEILVGDEGESPFSLDFLVAASAGPIGTDDKSSQFVMAFFFADPIRGEEVLILGFAQGARKELLNVMNSMSVRLFLFEAESSPTTVTSAVPHLIMGDFYRIGIKKLLLSSDQESNYVAYMSLGTYEVKHQLKEKHQLEQQKRNEAAAVVASKAAADAALAAALAHDATPVLAKATALNPFHYSLTFEGGSCGFNIRKNKIGFHCVSGISDACVKEFGITGPSVGDVISRIGATYLTFGMAIHAVKELAVSEFNLRLQGAQVQGAQVQGPVFEFLSTKSRVSELRVSQRVSKGVSTQDKDDEKNASEESQIQAAAEEKEQEEQRKREYEEQKRKIERKKEAHEINKVKSKLLYGEKCRILSNKWIDCTHEEVRTSGVLNHMQLFPGRSAPFNMSPEEEIRRAMVKNKKFVSKNYGLETGSKVVILKSGKWKTAIVEEHLPLNNVKLSVRVEGDGVIKSIKDGKYVALPQQDFELISRPGFDFYAYSEENGTWERCSLQGTSSMRFKVKFENDEVKTVSKTNIFSYPDKFQEEALSLIEREKTVFEANEKELAERVLGTTEKQGRSTRYWLGMRWGDKIEWLILEEKLNKE